MKFASALLALLTLLAAGCATSPQERWSHLEVGMTRQQVVDLLGVPTKSTSNGALIVLDYDFSQQQPTAVHHAQPGNSSYYVMIGRDERVRSFGQN